ncbi:hypothetical protein B0A55_05748 [Friedmanniomyces simplex]|uniref:Rhodopsin domain-containing protein n=1 Tax=Friedmanniomyces simplex TaxID=329884 RepID=A0A4U0X5K2_9PEZI|nr:hypothetical protein B0A55_05748 [Friedmanniomyces simplex]
MASVPSRPAELSDSTHHGGWVIIISAIFLVLLILCLAIRAYVRTSYSTIAGSPDYVLAVAGVVGIIQTSLVFWEVSKGLGTSIELLSISDVHLLQKSWFASTVLYLIALWLAKCCVLFVYLQLTPNKGHNLASWAVIGFSTVWVFISILMIGVDCELNTPWSHLASQCTGLFARWQVITALDVITEVVIFSLSIYLVFGLQMPVKRKTVIVAAFGLRLFVILPSILRLHYYSTYINSANPTLALSNVAIWTEVQMHTSIIACVSYCFKSFTAAVSTNYGATAINIEVYDSTNNRTGFTRGGGYGANSKMQSSNSGGSQGAFVGHRGGQNRTTVTTGSKRLSSKTSNDSQKVIILDEIRIEQD